MPNIVIVAALFRLLAVAPCAASRSSLLPKPHRRRGNKHVFKVDEVIYLADKPGRGYRGVLRRADDKRIFQPDRRKQLEKLACSKVKKEEECSRPNCTWNGRKCEKTKFSMGAVGVYGCKPGYAKIDDQVICEKAARSLKKKWKGSGNHVMYPYGCVAHRGSKGAARWNQQSGMTNDGQPFALICQKAPCIKGLMVSPKCVDTWHEGRDTGKVCASGTAGAWCSEDTEYSKSTSSLFWGNFFGTPTHLCSRCR